MNREALKDFIGLKVSFAATYRKTTLTAGFSRSRRVLLEDIISNSFDSVISHLWVDNSYRFDNLSLKDGDSISFDAIVGTYIGMKLETKYRLYHIRNIKKL